VAVRRGGHQFSRPAARPRRMTEWLSKDAQGAAITLPAASVLFDSSLDAAEKAKLPFTIVRTRGRVLVVSDQAGSVEDQIGAIGALIVTDTASALGITAIPDPVTDGDSDVWFLFQHFSGGSAEVLAGRRGFAIDFDSKAMRKVQEGEDVAFVIANQHATFGLKYYWQIRMLIKLH